MDTEYREKGRKIVGITGVLIFLFFSIVMGYMISHIEYVSVYKNFTTAMVFEVVGMVILLGFIFWNFVSRTKIKVGYFIPIVVSTIIYSLVFNVLNIWGSMTMSNGFFFGTHLTILFFYFVIVFPMYIMGKE